MDIGHLRDMGPISAKIPRVRGQSMNFTIYTVTTIKIRLCPQGCEIVQEIVRRGRETGSFCM
jgi:hypothetical protein